ncbi:unnamed protein product [Owenia fusiformis]|uniref:Uncharacterized protein n=1 Tax=Owenia fusiformis TaxID=6347 RepID=A0A8J1U097_OWEFU|nr:unnamed protein product [Owenia fusiformis]
MALHYQRTDLGLYGASRYFLNNAFIGKYRIGSEVLRVKSLSLAAVDFANMSVPTTDFGTLREGLQYALDFELDSYSTVADQVKIIGLCGAPSEVTTLSSTFLEAQYNVIRELYTFISQLNYTDPEGTAEMLFDKIVLMNPDFVPQYAIVKPFRDSDQLQSGLFDEGFWDLLPRGFGSETFFGYRISKKERR